MHNHSSAIPRLALGLGILLLAAFACAAPGSTPGGGTPSGGPEPIGTAQEQLTVTQDITFGTGTFILGDPRVGLSDLASYTATLTLSFDGTKDGKAQKWTKTYVMLVNKNPQSRQLTVQKSGDLTNLDTVHMAERDGVAYSWQGDNTCMGDPIQEGESLGDRLEPAGFLSFVVGAVEAGTETVNKAPSTHYTFDEHALAQENLTQSNGELWLATDGGYVVKYLLSSKGKADYFGDGMEGTLTQDYELTGVGEPAEIQLPADCPEGMVDAPLLSDATDVERNPGALSYTSATGLKDAAAFYQKELPKLGWKAQADSSVSKDNASLHFLQENQDLIVSITVEGNVTTVYISVQGVQKQ